MAASKKRTKKQSKKRQEQNNQAAEKSFMGAEIALIAVFLISLLLFLSNFGIIGTAGNFIRKIQLGFFGVAGYVFPVALFVMVLLILSNLDNHKIWLKALAVLFVIISVCSLTAIFAGSGTISAGDLEYRAGGTLGYFIAGAVGSAVGPIGAFIIMLMVLVVSVVYLTEKSIVNAIKSGSRRAYEYAKEDASIRRLEHTARTSERLARRREEALRRVNGIDFGATDLSKADGTYSANGEDSRTDSGTDSNARVMIKDKDEFSTPFDDVKQVDPNTFYGNIVKPEPIAEEDDTVPFDEDVSAPAVNNIQQGYKPSVGQETEAEADDQDEIRVDEEAIYTATGKRIFTDDELAQQRIKEKRENTELGQTRQEVEKRSRTARLKPYRIPPMNLLNRSTKTGSNQEDDEIRQTAIKLQQTLDTFGISVTVTDISCGPTVTRYELHPEVGVKVAKILALQDDLKLALAAESIRIEAPIPGKAAIGIEVPNKESSTVHLRDIFETREFRESRARLVFAIGKDISGTPVIADLARMPHVLIAGATGSGKSVCINTLILSLLYKYSPTDVKMIMIDPKMVELSCYNGIPHLLIPVVTDVKKATGALNWAVAEMEDRYRKFEAIGAKDIQSYNDSITQAKESLEAGGRSAEELPAKMPNIVIIVDELADMMMQCKADVEPAIVRISQLARAAGMHLVIATQRPSVNVITGLIKANIPSRIALAVTSGVDSRTIIDTVGAERLLGHGDMFYFPQDVAKPVRAQGAFVSEAEIHSVVNYILKENIEPSYDENTYEKMIMPAADVNTGQGDERDELFVQAGRFIIDKQKASIGFLQRAFRIGFNRAARIMDQLCDAGVVGPEQGTKPRDILMTEEEFEAFCAQE